jgi:hypothetical protein
MIRTRTAELQSQLSRTARDMLKMTPSLKTRKSSKRTHEKIPESSGIFRV